MPQDSGLTKTPAAVPRPGQSSPDFVREYAASLLSEPTKENLIRSVAKMDAMAEMEIAKLRKDAQGRVACQIGCDHCCYRIVGLGVPELIQIAERVKTRFSPAQTTALLERCDRYATSSLPFRSGRLGLARPPCPFLNDRKCSIYDVRPLGCRGLNSRSAVACEVRKKQPETAPPLPLDPRQNSVAQTISDAEMTAAHQKGLDHYYVDILAIRELIEHPEEIERYLGGKAILRQHALIAPGPDKIVEAQKRAERNRIEPSGFAPHAAVPGHPVYEFLRLAIPSAFSSHEQVIGSLQRYRDLIDDFLGVEMPSGTAFDGLQGFETTGLLYSGEDVTDLLTMVGGNIVSPIVANALPDLVLPIEARAPEGKLRVGYLSSKMSANNATTQVFGWLSPAEDIESFVFNVGPIEDQVSLGYRLAVGPNYFHLPGDVPSTARFIKSLSLDVLVFPDAGNDGTSYQYASMRLAPVQCATFGRPATSGLFTIDYYLSPESMEAGDSESHYQEKLIRLPGNGCFWDAELPVANSKSREELGLPEGDFYLVAQNLRKLAPKWDHLYAEIQAKTRAPILFIEFGAEPVIDVTRERLENSGIMATWIPIQPIEDLLRISQFAVASLDTPAWNGRTTTLFTLAVQGAVVTLQGSSLRSRIGSAYLRQAGLSKLVAGSTEEYVEIATDKDRISETMKAAQPSGMLEDARVPEALHAFYRRVAGRD